MPIAVFHVFTGKGLLETKELLKPVPFEPPIIQEAISLFFLLVLSRDMGSTQEKTGK